MTKEKLLTLLTPKPDKGIEFTTRRIPIIEYNSRKRALMVKMNKIFNIIQIGYWDILENCILKLGSRTTPLKFMLQIHKLDAIDITSERKNALLIDYIIELFIVMQMLKHLEDYVENSIDYNELLY
jgi:hypothetical protein